MKKELLLTEPQNADVHHYLGGVLIQQGNLAEAITHLEELSALLKPDKAESMNDLAWTLSVREKSAIYNPSKAIRLARQACEFTKYMKPEFLDTLAVAYAAAGNLNKAVETTEKALELCQSPKQELMKKDIKSRLVLFKAGKTYSSINN